VKSEPLREAGFLHVDADKGKVKKILCYKFDEHVGNTSRILLLSLRTIRDANIDILHHMDKSLEGISSPLLFLHDRKPRKSKKKGLSSRAFEQVSAGAEKEASSRQFVHHLFSI
jgi:hypothetical protein